MDLGVAEHIDDLEFRLMNLEQRNKELIIELMQRSAQASGAREEAIRLRAEVKNLNEKLIAPDFISKMTLIGKDLAEQVLKLLSEESEVRRLLMLITIHKDQTGHNLCWMNDLRLWREALNDSSIEYPHRTIPKHKEFVEVGCEAYCRPYFESRFIPVLPPAVPGMPEMPNP